MARCWMATSYFLDRWWPSLLMHIWNTCHWWVNTLRPRQNGRHFPDDSFKWIFFNENVWISIEVSLKFILKGPINNIPALVEIMAWRRPGDKPLSDPMMVSLLTHICVTHPQGWGQFLFFNSIPIPIPLRSIPIPIPIPLGWKIAIPIPIPIPFYQFQFQFQFLFINSFSIPF